MRISKAPLFRFIACLAMFAILAGSTVAGAVEKKDGKAQNKIHTSPYKGEPFFFKLQRVSNCASSCCTAYASCGTGVPTTSCTNTGCYASCSDGGSSFTAC